MKAGEHYFVSSGTLDMFADALSLEVNQPVVAELGDLAARYGGFYSTCFAYEKGSIPSLIAGLEEHVGFTLTLETREVEVLVVRKRQNQGSVPGQR
jgi:hypothetical protein